MANVWKLPQIVTMEKLYIENWHGWCPSIRRLHPVYTNSIDLPFPNYMLSKYHERSRSTRLDFCTD